MQTERLTFGNLFADKAIENKIKRGKVKGLKTDENGKGIGGAIIGLFRYDETDGWV